MIYDAQICRCGTLLRYFRGPVLADMTRVQDIPDEYLERPFESLPLAYHVARMVGHWLYWLAPEGGLIRACPTCRRILPDVELFGTPDQHPTAHEPAIRRALRATAKIRAIVLEPLVEPDAQQSITLPTLKTVSVHGEVWERDTEKRKKEVNSNGR